MDQLVKAERAVLVRRPTEWAPAKLAKALLLTAAGCLAAAPTSSHMTVAAALSRTQPPIAAVATGISPMDVLPLSRESALVINQRRPFDGAVMGLAPFRFMGGPLDQLRAIDCLAAAAYYEAGDDLGGERAVVQVVLNRVRHPSFPKTVCGVVFQGSERRTGCQFTFTCDGALARTPPRAAWARARAVAAAALAGAVDVRVGTATHYHADYVVPYWSSSLIKLAQVGAHIFYRWPGQWGRPGAFLKAGSDSEPAISALARLDPSTAIEAIPNPADEKTPQLAGLPTAPATIAPGAAAPPTSAVLMVAEESAAPGRWALSALNKCTGRADCQVLVYARSDQVERNRSLPAENREVPLFLFLRDAASGMTVSLWDCQAVERPNRSQCLPGPGAELRRLLRDRPVQKGRQAA